MPDTVNSSSERRSAVPAPSRGLPILSTEPLTAHERDLLRRAGENGGRRDLLGAAAGRYQVWPARTVIRLGKP